MIDPLTDIKLDHATEVEKVIYDFNATHLKNFKRGLRLKKPRKSWRLVREIEYRSRARKRKIRMGFAMGAIAMSVLGAIGYVLWKRNKQNPQVPKSEDGSPEKES